MYAWLNTDGDKMTTFDKMKKLLGMKSSDMKDLTIPDRLELNSLSLEVMFLFKTLCKTEGWQIFELEVEKDIARQKKKLAKLAIDPDKHKWELVAMATAVDILQTLINRVGKAEDKEGYLIEEQKRLVEEINSQQ